MSDRDNTYFPFLFSLTYFDVVTFYLFLNDKMQFPIGGV